MTTDITERCIERLICTALTGSPCLLRQFILCSGGSLHGRW